MLSNYHTHTWHCRHAKDREEEYVNRALEGNFQILGFADHAPYWFEGDYYSTFRMFPEEMEDYVKTVLSLREKYADKLKIHLGFEAEYYPKYFPEFLKRMQDAPVEYLILGQHYMGNEIGYTNVSFTPTDDRKMLAEYYDQVIEGINTGVFTYIAHPDIFHFCGATGAYQAEVRRLCREAKACNMPLEINLLGLREGRHYPNADFWQVAAEEGCQVIIGADAHTAKDTWDPQTERKALDLVREYGLDLLLRVELRPVTV